MDVPDKVYEVFNLWRIRERRVLGSDGQSLVIDDGVKVRVQLKDGVYKNGMGFIYFPTHEAARTAALDMCHKRIKQAEKEIASNRRAVKKLEGMVK